MARRERKGRKKYLPKTKPEKLGLFYAENPFADAEPEELRRAFVEIGQRKAEQFPDLVARTFEITKSIYPPYALSVISSHGLSAAVSNKTGAASTTMLPHIEQHTVEIFQALILTIPQAEWHFGPPNPEAIQGLIETLPQLTQAFAQRRFAIMDQDQDLNQKTIRFLQEIIRLHTQLVRNWGYYDRVVQLSKEIYASIDRELNQKIGFTATQFIETVNQIKIEKEKRYNEWFKELKRIFRKNRKPEIIKAYSEIYSRESDKLFIASLDEKVDLNEMRALLIANAEKYLLVQAIVDIEGAALKIGVSSHIIEKMLQEVSLSPGQLEGKELEHIFLDNPVWKSPCVKLDGHYYFPAPHLIFSHIHTIIRSFAVKSDASTIMERGRAKFLENKLREIVLSRLPDAKVVSSLKWKHEGKDYENDLVASFDKILMIFEAKSAALTPQGLRGAPDRVKRHVRDLVIDPSVQSARLEHIIKLAKQGSKSEVEILKSIDIDYSKIEEIVRVSVTIDNFSMIALAVASLKEAGWAPIDLDLAPSIAIADFEIIAEILDQPLLFVHYLSERRRLQSVLDVHGDELDLLGYYIETGFNIGAIEDEGYRLSVSGMSRALDIYFDSSAVGIKLAKPRMKLSTYFFRLLTMLSDRHREHWTTIGLSILRCADPREQNRIDRMLDKLRKSVPKNFRDPQHHCSVVIQPPKQRNTIAAFYVYRRVDRNRRNELMQRLADSILANHDVKRLIVIARMVEEWDVPYQAIAVFNRSEAQQDL